MERPACGALDRLYFAEHDMAARVATAMATIARALAVAKRPYIALSGGKDSVAVMALTLAVRDDVPMLWTDDELEYPETVAWMEWWKAQAGDQLILGLGWARHAGWFDPWRNRPFWRDPLPGAAPTGMDADDWMARRGHDLTLTGLRANESHQRGRHLRRVVIQRGAPLYPVKSGCGLRCCPIWDWDEDMVWAYLAQMGVRYNAAYDRLAEIGIDRRAQRVGPLPLTPRHILRDGWPELLPALEARYGARWTR